MLPSNVQRRTTGHYDVQACARREQVSNDGRGGDNVFEVIEEQEDGAPLEMHLQRLQERNAADLAYIECVSDRSGNKTGIRYGGQGNEDHTILEMVDKLP